MAGLNTDPVVHAILAAFEETSFARVFFNGVEAWMPAGTLITMYHCVHFVDNRVVFYVETEHSEWMFSKLTDNCVFMDVGAATGAMTVPFAMKRKDIEVFAFEPALRARDLLKRTIERNDIANVELFECAVSNVDGTATFNEQSVDETGQTPFLPETSALTHSDGPRTGEVHEVETIRLDSFAAKKGLNGRNIVLKIDIEGFEIFALEGAQSFLANNKVFMSIDIHSHLSGEGTTEDGCRRLLEPLGYSFTKQGHVLLCTPSNH